MTRQRKGTGRNKHGFMPQALFQDGSDLPLFTGYNPQPEGATPNTDVRIRKPKSETPVVADALTSLPVYHLTRVVEFSPNPPDRWGMLTGKPFPVCSGTLVCILGVSPHDSEFYLIEYEGRYAWTWWVGAV